MQFVYTAKRRDALLEKYKDESKESRERANWMVFLYAIGTIIAFILAMHRLWAEIILFMIVRRINQDGALKIKFDDLHNLLIEKMKEYKR